MFSWLRRSNPIQEAIDAEEYENAMDLIRDEMNNDPRKTKTRPLMQTMAEVMVLRGQSDAAIMMLKKLVKEYSNAGQKAKSIAIQKRLEELIEEEDEAEQALEEAAAAAIEPVDYEELPKVINLVSMEGDSEAMPEKTTAAIARAPIFSDMSKAEVRAFIKGLDLQVKEPGDLLMVEGEPGDSLFILTDGVVKVHVRNQAKKSQEIREMDSGTFFGEISIVYGRPRSATISCKTPCEVLELSKAGLDEMVATHPNIQVVMKKFCDQRIDSEEEKEVRKSN